MALQARLHLEENESRVLAPYATFSCRSLGRQFEESIHLYHTDFQLDRERILDSAAFPKLEHKSEIILNEGGDLYRSRLSHTMQTACLSRSIARTLRLNEDLVEAAALGRDLGCPPFGRTGAETLDQLMRDHGGFTPGQQSRRIVEELEMIFPPFNGLNLTQEVRDSLAATDGMATLPSLQPTLETQAVESVRDLTTLLLDLGDALTHGFVSEESVAEIALWMEARSQVDLIYAKMEKSRKRRFTLHQLQNQLVLNLLTQSSDNLESARYADAAAARKAPRRLIGFSVETRAAMQNLHNFLEQHLHHHPAINRANQRAAMVLQSLFSFFRKHPQLIDDRAQLKIKKEGIDRAVCDHLAALTDVEAYRAYARHLGTDNLLSDLAPRQPVV
jgi:dGTPase